MPANQRQKTAQSPPSPSTKVTAKYTNKDGSKFITVPKSANISDPSETPQAMAQPTATSNGQTPTSPPHTNGSAPAVNRKKQKRREKQAAKLAAEQPTVPKTNGAAPKSTPKGQMQDLHQRFRDVVLDERYDENSHFDPAEEDPYYSEEDGDAYSGLYGQNDSVANGYAQPKHSGKGSKKKKKAQGSQPGSLSHQNNSNGAPQSQLSLPLSTLGTNMPRGPGISKEKIWNTSNQEERERIKEFWLSLGEDERKSLVKVEKDAVLKKMKEQQKHSCSCTVCGRKRTAIEEELEVLYDAYYEELEQYANHQGDGGPTMPPPRRFGAISGLQPPHLLPPTFNGQQPSRGRIVEHPGDDEDDEEGEDYSEDDGDDDDYSDEEPEEIPRSHAQDFFNFGNSLTVQGGILTVADDLLKNDGKKFIEMMEQLAERRMAREEDSREVFTSPSNYGHLQNGAMHNHNHPHNHPPPPDDEEYDDEDEEDEDYDSQEEDYDDEEVDTMTEEQRMEEGRRMFQIFAARMFEQRVLTAYKDKVAKERQQKLLEELEEENLADKQKKAKKARDAQKKKEKAAQKKQLQAEEKAKREAEKAAEEAAAREANEKKLEEQRLKSEEKRKKKEAQRKAEEEERARVEAEKQRLLKEKRDKERKQREANQAQKLQRDKEAKEAREREAKEKLEKLENEKREKREKQEKAAKAQSEREAKEKLKREGIAAQQAAAQAALAATQAKRPPVPKPANLQPHPVASPHIPVATPAITKAPTPMKLRTTSQQDSNSSVPRTPQTGSASNNVSPVPSTPLQDSPGPVGPPGKNQNPHLYHPQAASPIHAALKSPPGIQPLPPFGAMGPMFNHPAMPILSPGFGAGRMQHEPMFPNQPMGGFRPLPGMNGMPLQPGLGMHVPQGRGFNVPYGPPGFSQQVPNGMGGIGQAFGAPKDGPPQQSHSRHHSGSYDVGGAQAQPIGRPAPIGRPGSIVHNNHRHGDSDKNDMEELSNHLGSSALLDDSDEPLNPGIGARRSSAAPGGVGRQQFGSPFSNSPYGIPMSNYNSWGGSNPFAPSSLPGSNYTGGGWGSSTNSSFGVLGAALPLRSSHSRPITVRLLLTQACKNLDGTSPDGFIDVKLVKKEVDSINQSDDPVTESELLDICETEGNAVNGGGSFDVRGDGPTRSIRYQIDAPPPHRPLGAPGEIGSPIMANNSISRFPAPPPGF